MIRLEIAPDAAALAALAAEKVTGLAAEALTERGMFTLAVSGGSTPAGMFRELAQRPLPWKRIHLFQVDERVAPDGDPDRNLGELQEKLLDRVAIPAGNVHLMPVTAPDLAASASAYARELRRVCGGDGTLDLVHLGLGDDGHTASWPPGDPVVEVVDTDVAVVGPYRGRLRMTLTPPAVNRARCILWLVSGTDKARILQDLLSGKPSLPASHVRTDRATVVADATSLRGAPGASRPDAQRPPGIEPRSR